MNLLQKLTWKDVRQEVNSLNPELTKLIDNINPGKEYYIYKLNCPWGQHLLHEGVLHLPNEKGTWVPLTHNSINPKVANDLAYNTSMPLGIILNSSAELYIEALDRIIPFMFMKPGTIFGLWVSLHNDKTATNHTGRVSNIIAGSRSTVMLPKITDISSFKKLQKEFELRCIQPTGLSDQWSLLLELSQHEKFPQKWQTSVIYFSKKWLEPQDSIDWKLFKNYLLEQAWHRTDYLRNQIVSDIAFSCALEEKSLRPDPYLTDTVKHVFSICQDIYPGYEVGTNSLAIPLEGFQSVFDEIYGLRYQPTFMVPGYLNSDPLKSLYYSLEIPTLMSFSPKSRKLANKLEDLREIKHITRRVIEYLLSDKLNLGLSKGAPLYKLVHETNFEYYHTEEDRYEEIKKTDNLEAIDHNILLESKKFGKKQFCDTSQFLRGCIRVSTKKPQQGELNEVK